MTASGDKGSPFEFTTAGKIVFKRGGLADLGSLGSSLGSTALVITGATPSRATTVVSLLQAASIRHELFPIAGEPTVGEVRAACLAARKLGATWILGFGGGSPIDAAKATAALVGNPGDPMDYLEIVGKNQPLTHPGLPCIAIPTTAGTGAEVTRNSVLTSPEHALKVSLRSPWILPKVALIDPELLLPLPPPLTASTGMDALTQLIEPYVSTRANPLTDGFCLDGLRRVARSLERCCQVPHDITAREDMALASLQGGLALTNAGLGAVHGFASPIGGISGAAHGSVCAALLASTLEANIQALRLRSPNSGTLSRFRYIARILTGKEESSADACVSWVRELSLRLGLPRLRELGIEQGQFAALVEKAAQSNSMKANPILLTAAELHGILERAW